MAVKDEFILSLKVSVVGYNCILKPASISFLIPHPDNLMKPVEWWPIVHAF